MILKPGDLGSLQQARNIGDRAVPGTLSTDTRFKDIMMMLQKDGVIATNAPQPAQPLAGAQKAQLREEFDIDNMAAFPQKRALLNRLVGLGQISAEESELSGMQLLPPFSATGVAMPPVASVDEMLDEPNYLAHLEKAMRLDELWSHSADVRDARAKLHGVLTDIFS